MVSSIMSKRFTREMTKAAPTFVGDLRKGIWQNTDGMAIIGCKNHRTHSLENACYKLGGLFADAKAQ